MSAILEWLVAKCLEKYGVEGTFNGITSLPNFITSKATRVAKALHCGTRGHDLVNGICDRISAI
jgi:hypothetical protein